MLLKKAKVVQCSQTGLSIQKSSGKVNIYNTTWCIIGPPGVGKTTLASGFDSVLYLCTSEKELSRLTVDYLLIDSWEKILKVTDELLNNREKYAQYKFLAIDFVDAVWEMCRVSSNEKLKVPHESDAQWGKGSGMIRSFFKQWISKLVASTYGIVFISHVTDVDSFANGGQIKKTVCTLPKNAREILFPLINVLGCIEYKSVKGTNAATGKPEIQRKRVMVFEATEYVEAKDRDGIFPSELMLFKDPKKNFEMFKDYYEGRRKK